MHSRIRTFLLLSITCSNLVLANTNTTSTPAPDTWKTKTGLIAGAAAAGGISLFSLISAGCNEVFGCFLDLGAGTAVGLAGAVTHTNVPYNGSIQNYCRNRLLAAAAFFGIVALVTGGLSTLY